ncbi:MAG: response regulator [Clostridia bacterium]|nr:response regulator [Clostridia bacterium]
MIYLVVDDEIAICQGTVRRLRQFLEAEDTVISASSGEEALEKFGAQRPDIVITDIRMGTMSGLDFLAEAQRQWADFASIIVTAYDQFSYAQQAIRLGVEDYLVKPYTVSELRQAVQRAARRLSESRSARRAVLDKALDQAVRMGGRLEARMFAEAGYPAPPENVSLAIWQGDLPSPLSPAGWHYGDAQRRYCLGAPGALSAAFAALTGVRAGISLPGDDLGKMLSQARRALEISAYPGMPAVVVYREEFATDELFRQGAAVAFAMDYVRKHMGEPISMDTVCEKLHMNYSYFSRQFKQQTGLSFSHFLLREQMQWAAERMRGGMRVNEAAGVLGYQSVESFSKAFSRIYGISPRGYLQKEEKNR